MSVATLYDWVCRILGIAFMVFMVYVLIAGIRQPVADARPRQPATESRQQRHADLPVAAPRWERRDDGLIVLLSHERRGEP